MTTVSVFGGTGFLGRRLVRRLAAERSDAAHRGSFSRAGAKRPPNG
jgi:uncharacterized protein YbjT (DUF2867 family)